MHTNETSRAGLALYKYYISSRGDLNYAELMCKKHDLFLAVLQAGGNSEAKIANPLDQAILACNLLASGKWRKASLVRSFMNIVLWCLSAVTAHWCRLSVTEDGHYVPFSQDKLDSLSLHPLEVESSIHAHVPLGAVLKETNEDDQSDGAGYDGEDEDEDEDEANINELPNDFDPSQIDAWEVNSVLQRLSNVLDISGDPEQGVRGEEMLNPLAVNQ